MQTTEQIDPIEIASARLMAGSEIAHVAQALGLDVVDAETSEQMLAAPGYHCDDGSGAIYLQHAATSADAAASYVSGGDYPSDPDEPATTWIAVRVWREGVRIQRVECSYCSARATAHDADGSPACSQHAETPEPDATLAPLDAQIVQCRTESESVTVAVDPDEPPCRAGHQHDWQSPHAIVGGSAENPGVRGHGGGVIITEACMVCGCGRRTDTWAANPATGEQGLESVTYCPGEYLGDEA